MQTDAEKNRLHSLFRACDVDNSGRIEKWEFLKICSELHVRSADVDEIFSKLDTDRDGTINLEEFIHGFDGVANIMQKEDMDSADTLSLAWEDFKTRLSDQAKYIPRIDQVATMYQNISLTEPRMVPQFERVVMSFIREIKLQNTEMEHLALAVKRAQDHATMQLSEMEEEMDQRIHSSEWNTRQQESKKAEAALSNMKHQYEAQLYEFQQKFEVMQKIEEQNKSVSLKEEASLLKRKNNEMTLENQRLKQELLESHTNIAFLQSELDSLKSDLTDHSINCERDEALMQCFAEERDNLERQIEMLQSANRKLHDTNDSLRAALETSQSRSKSQRGSGFSPGNTVSRQKGFGSPHLDRCYNLHCVGESYEQLPHSEGGRRPSCDAMAFALCDPMRRLSFEAESLAESCFDSGLSTLRSSNGYDSEQDAGCYLNPRATAPATDSLGGDTEDTETNDIKEEAVSGSDGESAQDWKPRLPVVRNDSSSSERKCLSAIFSETEMDETDLSKGSHKTYRVVLAGDAAVGKSSFLLRLCKNEFRGDTCATLGVDFQVKTLVVDGVPTVLQLWDTAGQERFRSIAKSYFRRADGVLLLYDVTCEQSFLNVREWVDTIEDVAEDDIPIMLVGNKSDLRQQALEDGITCIPTSYGEKLAMTYSSLFCETSAKDGSNIIEAVLHLAREVIKHSREKKTPPSVTKLSGSRDKKMPNLNCCTG